jgi:copper(I)-binding protein
LAALFATACVRDQTAVRAAEIEQGQALYAANGCGTCHGATGSGDGPVARTLSPPPRDFRDASAFKNGADPTSVANTIATGLTRDGGQMQSYFHLSGRERFLLARFVISLRDSAPIGVTRSELNVSDAWVREPMGSRGIASAYAVVQNLGTNELQIVGVTADVAGSVEMHEMTRAGDMMKMAPLKTVAVPAHETFAFEPGGAHLMLFDLKRPLKEGDQVTFTFTSGTGGSVTVAAAVKKAQAQQ